MASSRHIEVDQNKVVVLSKRRADLLKRPKPCPRCEGEGRVKSTRLQGGKELTGSIICPKCKGRKRIPRKDSLT